MYRTVSIIIPTHQRASSLARTLSCMRDLRIPNGIEAELIIAANACTDRTLEVARIAADELPFPTRCVIEPVPGAARARNTAMRHSKADCFIFFDDDVWIYPDCIVQMLDTFGRTQADIVIGKVELFWQDVVRPEWFNNECAVLLSEVDLGPQITRMHAFYGASANMGITREVAETIGLFREKLDRIGNRIFSCGETDLFARTHQAGGTIFYTPFARVRHFVDPSRCQTDYLCRVAYGNNYSQMLRRDDSRKLSMFASIVFKSYRLLLRYIRMCWTKTTGNQQAYMDYLIKTSATKGSIFGTIERLKTGPLPYSESLSPRNDMVLQEA